MSKSLDRLTLLATFARIAERGSISAAARDLGLSQASASRQLAALEDRLGIRLVQRTTHDLSLTEAGADCLVEARGLLDGWEALAERMAAEMGDGMGFETGGIRGKLKVVAPVALGQLHLIDAVLAFQQTHPAVSITWLLDDAAIRVAEIGCDLWLKIGRVPDDSLVVRPLGQVERLIVASPGFRAAGEIRTPADLGRVPCAALEPFDAASIPLHDRQGVVTTVTATVALSTNNIFSALAAARRGVGYAVMPRWLVEEDLRTGRLVDLLSGWRAPSLTINAAFLPMRRQTRRLRLLIDHVGTAVAAIPGVLAPDA